MLKKEEFRIVFMGTPEFAVPSLKAIIEAGYPVVGVITAPDKPAGRGKKLSPSCVKSFAEEQGIAVMQPTNLKDLQFLESLKTLSPQFQVVVAFRMLPRQVWDLPPYGTINLHASLLPQYRGAAPLNHAIMNGEKITGLTTFMLDKEIDTGNILLQRKLDIGADETVGELHDRMMTEGTGLLLETIELIRQNRVRPFKQNELIGDRGALKSAPKIFKEQCRIDWNKEGQDINNFVRGLSPYPTAYSFLNSPDKEQYLLKIYKSRFEEVPTMHPSGSIVTDGKSFLKVATKNDYLYLLEVQLAGKKRLQITDFLHGFHLDESWKFI